VMHKENFKHKCQECPTCVDCSSGTPKLRSGYTLSGTGQLNERGEFVVNQPAGVMERPCTNHVNGVCPNATSGTQLWAVHYAYFCDEDTAVTPTDMQDFKYFTDKPANDRCKNAEQSVVLAVRHVTARPEGEQGDTSERCSVGYAGRFCRSCNDSPDQDGSRYYRPPGKDRCVKCAAKDSVNWIAVSIPLVCLLLSVGYAVTRCFRKKTRESESLVEQKKRCANMPMFRVALFPLVKILITYAQVTGQLSHVLHVIYPPTFSRSVSSFKWLLDFWSLFISPECMGFGSFWAKWVLRIVGQPLLFCVIVQIIYVLERSWGETAKQASENWWQNILRALFLSYPSVCNVAFCALDCRNVDETQSVLVDDDRIRCWTAKHYLFVIFSAIVIAVLGFGLPVFFVWRLQTASRKAHAEMSKNEQLVEQMTAELVPDVEASSEVSEHTGAEAVRFETVKQHVRSALVESTQLTKFSSMTEAYKMKPECVYFEAVDMTRKLLLVGVVVLAGRGSVLQNVLANMLSFCFFAWHMSRWPFKMREDNWLRASCELHVFCTITTAFVMKSDLSHEELHGVKVQGPFYDWVLLISLVILVPGVFLVALCSKLRRFPQQATQYIEIPLRATETSPEVPCDEFARYCIGLASSSDRAALRKCVCCCLSVCTRVFVPACARAF
jgi:hypothetical protein